eukprot:gene2931-5756_t
MEKYTAIVRKGPTGLGIHWMQDENASSFIIESIDKDVCLVSTSPPIIKQILPNDEVLNIALFSAAKNGYYNVKMMQFKEMNIPDGLLVRLDLKRVSVRSANTTATAKLKPTTTSHFGQIQSLSTTSTKITPIAKEKPQVVSPFGSHSFTTPNKTIPSNSTNIFIQQSFISPNTVTATAAISSAYKASVDSLDSVGSRILTPSERMVSTTSNGTGTMNMNRVNVIIRAPGHLSPSLSSESQSQQHQQVLSFSRPRTFHPMPVVMTVSHFNFIS